MVEKKWNVNFKAFRLYECLCPCFVFFQEKARYILRLDRKFTLTMIHPCFSLFLNCTRIYFFFFEKLLQYLLVWKNLQKKLYVFIFMKKSIYPDQINLHAFMQDVNLWNRRRFFCTLYLVRSIFNAPEPSILLYLVNSRGQTVWNSMSALYVYSTGVVVCKNDIPMYFINLHRSYCDCLT